MIYSRYSRKKTIDANNLSRVEFMQLMNICDAINDLSDEGQDVLLDVLKCSSNRIAKKISICPYNS